MTKNITQNSIEDLLNREGIILYKIVGKSMEPMLRPNRDLVIIRKKQIDEKFFENDVVLLKSRGKLILHRIIRVDDLGKYVILGDNSSQIDYNINKDSIIGILQGFYRDKVFYSTKDGKYLSYVKKIRTCENERIVKKKYMI